MKKIQIFNKKHPYFVTSNLARRTISIYSGTEGVLGYLERGDFDWGSKYGSCDWWEVQARAEDWERILRRAVFGYMKF